MSLLVYYKILQFLLLPFRLWGGAYTKIIYKNIILSNLILTTPILSEIRFISVISFHILFSIHNPIPSISRCHPVIIQIVFIPPPYQHFSLPTNLNYSYYIQSCDKGFFELLYSFFTRYFLQLKYVIFNRNSMLLLYFLDLRGAFCRVCGSVTFFAYGEYDIGGFSRVISPSPGLLPSGRSGVQRIGLFYIFSRPSTFICHIRALLVFADFSFYSLVFVYRSFVLLSLLYVRHNYWTHLLLQFSSTLPSPFLIPLQIPVFCSSLFEFRE